METVVGNYTGNNKRASGTRRNGRRDFARRLRIVALAFARNARGAIHRCRLGILRSGTRARLDKLNEEARREQRAEHSDYWNKRARRSETVARRHGRRESAGVAEGGTRRTTPSTTSSRRKSRRFKTQAAAPAGRGRFLQADSANSGSEVCRLSQRRQTESRLATRFTRRGHHRRQERWPGHRSK